MDLEKKLEFSQIKELLTLECLSEAGKRFVEQIKFGTNFEKITQNLSETEEFRLILLSPDAFPAQNYFDLSEELKRLRLDGTRIDQEALFEMKLSLRTIADCLQYFLKEKEILYPLLTVEAQKIVFKKEILKRADQIIDDKGHIPDNASPELYDIRKSIVRTTIAIDRKIAKIFGQAKKENWTPPDAEINIRNGRMVIPLINTHRRKIQGFIQDESATRQTIYVEPIEIVELNNELRELEFAERREIDKILLEFSDLIRPHISDLLNAYWFLGKMDFLRAKARFALKINAVKPVLSNIQTIGWLNARHPLLYLSLQKQHKEVVPLTVSLTKEKSILIISGPNAGGKSVCLKTIGLLQYMLQCGLLIPVKEISECGIFDKIFIDIGDEQSIENDLSTYSSHLLNMKRLVENANHKTLFLIDEMGSGTEPVAGGAIAEAILETLNAKHSFGVATTHYANLKLLADRYSSILNGAMLFDTENLQPLYKLSVGKPGSSFAFEIAKKIGLPENVLKQASEKVGSSHLSFEQQLQTLEVEKRQTQQKQEELKVADEFLNEMIQKYQLLSAKIENQKTEIIQKAKAEAKQIILDSNKKIENTIAEIKSHQAEKEFTQNVRKELNEFVEELSKPLPVVEFPAENEIFPAKKKDKSKTPKPEKPQNLGPISVGDIVQIANSNTYVEVIAIKGKKAEISSHSMKMEVPLDTLIKTGKQKIPTVKSEATERFHNSVMDSINQKKAVFSPQVDLRGKRVEEALSIVKNLLDEAVLLAEKELILLHGKGNGVLRHVIREYLQAQPEVERFHSEHVERGGDGITIVKLK